MATLTLATLTLATGPRSRNPVDQKSADRWGRTSPRCAGCGCGYPWRRRFRRAVEADGSSDPTRDHRRLDLRDACSTAPVSTAAPAWLPRRRRAPPRGTLGGGRALRRFRGRAAPPIHPGRWPLRPGHRPPPGHRDNGRRLRFRMARRRGRGALGEVRSRCWTRFRPTGRAWPGRRRRAAPDGARAAGPLDVAAFMAAHPGPVVLKPADRAASVGTRVIALADKTEIEGAWLRCLVQDEGILVPDRPMEVSMLVEQFVTGREFSVGILLQGGFRLFANVTGKELFPGPRPGGAAIRFLGMEPVVVTEVRGLEERRGSPRASTSPPMIQVSRCRSGSRDRTPPRRGCRRPPARVPPALAVSRPRCRCESGS